MTTLFAASEKKSTVVPSQNGKNSISRTAKSVSHSAKKEVDSQEQSWVNKAIAVNKRLGHEATQGLLDKLYSISGDKANYDQAMKEMPGLRSGFVHLVLSTQKVLFPLEKERKEWDGILGDRTIERGEEALDSGYSFSELWNAIADFLSGVDDTVSDWWDSFIDWASGVPKLEIKDGIVQDSFMLHDRIERLERGKRVEKVKAIVLHRTDSRTQKSAVNWWKSEDNEDRYGTPFIIDKAGNITQTASLDQLTYHTRSNKKLNVGNKNSIGIELVGKFDKKKGEWEPLTKSQISSLKNLIERLKSTYDLEDKDLFFHYQVDPEHKEKGEGEEAYHKLLNK